MQLNNGTYQVKIKRLSNSKMLSFKRENCTVLCVKHHSTPPSGNKACWRKMASGQKKKPVRPANKSSPVADKQTTSKL